MLGLREELSMQFVIPVLVWRWGDGRSRGITVMQKYQPVAVQSVAESVRVLKSQIEDLQDEIRSHLDWYNQFKAALETNTKQISDLTKGLDAEKDVRRSGQDELTRALNSVQGTLSFLRGATWFVGVVLGIGVTIGIALIIAALTKHFP
jgi:predicted phage tail protein